MIPIRDTIPSLTRPWVNIGLIAFNVLAFLFELSLGPNLDPFIRGAALVPARALGAIAQGDWGSVIAPVFVSMFLHGGWAHLLGNMLYLWVFGDNVEDALGHFRYLLLYLATGVVAAASHVIFNPGATLPTVGASGAIAGVLGAYLVMYPRSRVVTLVPIVFFFTFVEVPAPLYLVFWFLTQLLSGTFEITHATTRAMEGTGGIAWFAHLGGFIAGVVLGLLLRRRDRVADRRARWANRYGY